MAKSLSITIHPAPLSGEYLTVADAMRQVLDFVEALEKIEGDEGERKIVWRLTEAHTNSPPFTVRAEAFSVNPAVAVGAEANRIIASLSDGFDELLSGQVPAWLEPEAAAPIKRILKRNLNGIGRTEIVAEDEPAVDVVPTTAKTAVAALDRQALESEAETPDLRRTEFGAVEGLMFGISRWNDKPAIVITERLSGERVTCVLSDELAVKLGPTHNWQEAWEGERLMISGALQYGSDGKLKRVDAEEADPLPWTNVPLSALSGINLLNGRSVSEHIRLLREEDD